MDRGTAQLLLVHRNLDDDIYCHLLHGMAGMGRTCHHHPGCCRPCFHYRDRDTTGDKGINSRYRLVHETSLLLVHKMSVEGDKTPKIRACPVLEIKQEEQEARRRMMQKKFIISPQNIPPQKKISDAPKKKGGCGCGNKKKTY